MKKYKFKAFKHFFLVCIATAMYIFFQQYPYQEKEETMTKLLNIQDYLITASGIISGIIIAYLAAKLFSIKEERKQCQIEIDRLSTKLTNYRRVLYCIINSSAFWVKRDDISKFQNEYQGYNFEMLHNQNNNDKKRDDFWAIDPGFCTTTVDLYLAMEAIYGIDKEILSWYSDRNARFKYTLQDIASYTKPSNQIWYYLEWKYFKDTEGLVNDTKINNRFKTSIRENYTQIDAKYRDREFDRHLLAEISADFESFYLPNLYELTRLNQESLPKSTVNLFINLSVIFIIGVFFPLFIQCLNISNHWNVFFTLSSVGIVTLAFINFLFDFYGIMIEDVKI